MPLIFNTYNSFCDNQLVVNTGIYLNLRKTMLIIILFLDIISRKRKITFLITLSVILITSSNVITFDEFKTDYFLYLIIILGIFFSTLYCELTVTYKKRTNSSSLKLFSYNSFLTMPLSFLLIIIPGEYTKLYEFFFNSSMDDDKNSCFIVDH